ncbi:MAG: NUDIX hydrolase [Parachlamydiaceae bacterium]|nr:NUDIX hydrolase [Parachlamydiaceae bacterium]
MQYDALASVPINKFFLKIYQEEPTVSPYRKGIRYGAPDASINITPDPYGGCHIDVMAAFSKKQGELIKEAIEDLSKIFKETKAFNSIWLNFSLPCPLSTIGMIAPDSFVIGTPGKCDLIYDRQENKMRVWSWLTDKVCTIPSGATHSVGGAALIIDEIERKILLVVNKDRIHSWNLPGGSFDPSDLSPSFTALREAQEEGGFQIEKSSNIEPRLIGQMQFPQNQFAAAISQIWAFFLDNISLKTLNPPQDEIERAEWITFDEVLRSDGTLKGYKLGLEIIESLKAATEGRGCQEQKQKNDGMIIHV